MSNLSNPYNPLDKLDNPSILSPSINQSLNSKRDAKIVEMKTNKEIASEILSEWMTPYYPSLVEMGLLSNSEIITRINDKIRKTGWVDDNYSILADLTPYMDHSAEAILKGMFYEVMEEIPDDMIPDLMHSIVRSAYEKGNLSLLGGRLKFNREQLESLKGIMKKHMPLEN